MTETPPNFNEPPSQLLASPTPKASRWKRAVLAGLLSLVFPGMGQLYNRRPRKAFSLALITYILDFLMVKTRLLFAFSTMVVTILGLGLWKLFVTAEAGYAAATGKKPEPAVPMPRVTYPVLAIIFFAAVFIPFPDLKSEAGFTSFKVPSASMCPTICLGERFVADTNAYKLKAPERGDLILMKHSSSNALFIKRVIGIAGDVVAPGPDGAISVNGQRFSPPTPCGANLLPQKNTDLTDSPVFQRTSVAEGTFFVVGDNIANSYDSRIPEFGPVTKEMVRGKPLFLYWSASHSRVGCAIR
jgi:signal peptidase I